MSSGACALLIESRAATQSLLHEQIGRIMASIAHFPVEKQVDFSEDPAVYNQLWKIRKETFPAVGAVRGLHFQLAPHAEMKLVRCLKGRVWDVAVDLRAGSPTFLQWHAETLSPDTMRMIVIPEGFAHGFQVLEPDSELLYLHTAAYNADAERAVRYDDPRLGIRWPLPVTQTSLRDAAHPPLGADFIGVHP